MVGASPAPPVDPPINLHVWAYRSRLTGAAIQLTHLLRNSYCHVDLLVLPYCGCHPDHRLTAQHFLPPKYKIITHITAPEYTLKLHTQCSLCSCPAATSQLPTLSGIQYLAPHSERSSHHAARGLPTPQGPSKYLPQCRQRCLLCGRVANQPASRWGSPQKLHQIRLGSSPAPSVFPMAASAAVRLPGAL